MFVYYLLIAMFVYAEGLSKNAVYNNMEAWICDST